jgi:hypothetical protein
MPGAAALRFDEGKHLQRCLVIELTAFSDDDALIQDVCREVLADPDFVDSRPSPTGAPVRTAFLVARAKALVLTRQRGRNAEPGRLDDLCRSVLPEWINAPPDEEVLVLVCLALMRIGQPCEWLLTDYYLHGRDRALVPDHWNKRGQCKKRLREMLSHSRDQGDGNPHT